MAENKRININNEGMKISDEQLESVSGGGKSSYGTCPYCGKQTYCRPLKQCKECGYGIDRAHDF